MKGATMLATLQRLGVVPSFSRPSVSNDHAFSEARFRTLKYTPAYPDGPCEDLAAAHTWVATFVPWYNEQHRHSAIQFGTPGQRHRGEDPELLRQRVTVYEAAKVRNPIRWSGNIRNGDSIGPVSLNPGNPLPKKGRGDSNFTNSNFRASRDAFMPWSWVPHRSPSRESPAGTVGLRHDPTTNVSMACRMRFAYPLHGRQ